MRSVVFLIPGDLDTRTGGYEYDRQIMDGLRAQGWKVVLCALDGGFPRPSAAALEQADAALAALERDSLVVVDGLALGAMPDQAAAHAERLRIVALLHHPLAMETGLDPTEIRLLHDSERRALQAVRRVVVTSARTARILADYQVAPDRVVVVEPGTEPASLARGSAHGMTSLICVASLSPRKGHEVMFRALADLTRYQWRLVCVGDHQRDVTTARRLRLLVQELGIADRVAMIGEADAADTAAFYDAADVFVLPTLYEGYGMAVAEALARGLPVISTPTGAIEDLVGDDAGILVPAGDVDGWRRALTDVFDPTVRLRLTDAARVRRLSLATWAIAAARMSEALTFHG